MKKQHTTKQHYVPRFLLKQFSGDDNHVFVLNRTNNKICRTSVDSICYENDIYDEKWKGADKKLGKYVLDNKIEDCLADLEAKASSLIKQIVVSIKSGDGCVRFTEEEHGLISEFITTLYLRNPYTLKSIVDYYQGVEDELDCEAMMYVVNYLFNTAKWGDPKSLLAYSIKAGIFSKEIEGSPYNIKYKKISNLKYVFWYAKEGGIITSSFPLHIISADGERVERIICPLSSEVALVLFGSIPYPLKEGMVIEIDENNLRWNMNLFYRMYSKEMARLFIAKDEETLNRIKKN